MHSTDTLYSLLVNPLECRTQDIYANDASITIISDNTHDERKVVCETETMMQVQFFVILYMRKTM